MTNKILKLFHECVNQNTYHGLHNPTDQHIGSYITRGAGIKAVNRTLVGVEAVILETVIVKTCVVGARQFAISESPRFRVYCCALVILNGRLCMNGDFLRSGGSW